MKQSKNLFKNFSLLSVGLCALCCALPIMGMVTGVGLLTWISAYVEWAGFAALLLATIFLGIYFFQRKKAAPACDIDCGCKDRHDEASAKLVQ